MDWSRVKPRIMIHGLGPPYMLRETSGGLGSFPCQPTANHGLVSSFPAGTDSPARHAGRLASAEVAGPLSLQFRLGPALGQGLLREGVRRGQAEQPLGR